MISDSYAYDLVTRQLSREPDYDLQQSRRWQADDITLHLMRRILGLLSEFLPLPPRSQIDLVFVDAPKRQRGQAQRLLNGRYVITLNRAECFDHTEFISVLAHEARHVSDMHTGLWYENDRATNERRAIDFQNAFIQRVPW